jgi:nitroreductase
MILKEISGRWSPRAFSNDPISQEELHILFEAARWAASGNNTQPWRFVFAHKGSDEFEALLSTLAEGNQVWAKNAPVLMGVFGRTRHEYKERENRTWMYELGLAVGQLGIQAQSMDIYLHQMGGFDPEKMAKVCKAPDVFEAMVAIALGRQGKPETLEEPLRSRETAERTRKPLSDIVIEGSFE